jgi:hypothetical protein
MTFGLDICVCVGVGLHLPCQFWSLGLTVARNVGSKLWGGLWLWFGFGFWLGFVFWLGLWLGSVLGYGFGTGLPTAIVEVKLCITCCSCSMIVCLTKVFVDKMDLSIQQRRDEMMAVLKEENERLKDELLAKLAEREKYVQERETTYQQMRKELDAQMNTEYF